MMFSPFEPGAPTRAPQVTCCHHMSCQLTPHTSRHARHHHEAIDQAGSMLCVLRRQAISIVHHSEGDDIQSS